jgi:hypothetical protein
MRSSFIDPLCGLAALRETSLLGLVRDEGRRRLVSREAAKPRKKLAAVTGFPSYSFTLQSEGEQGLAFRLLRGVQKEK